MKKTIIFLFCATSVYSCFSQKTCDYPACRIDFLKNKLYILTIDKPHFDSALKAAMTDEWTVSPIGGYISQKEFKEMRKSTENSFLEPAKFTWGSIRDERWIYALDFLRGHTNYPRPYINYETIALLDGYRQEEFDSSVYRLELIIRGANNDYKFANAADSIREKYTMALLKKKILLINERFMHKQKTKGDFFEPGAFENYSYKVEFASSEKILSIIKAKNNKYALCAPLSNDMASGVYVYDVETGFLLGNFKRKGFPGLIRPKDIELLEDKINE